MRTSDRRAGRALRAAVVAGLALVLGCTGVSVSAQTFPPLRESHDPELQQQLDTDVMSRPEFRRLIDARRAGVVVVDVTALERPRVAWYNPDLMLYAASLPKIAIVLGTFVEVDAGRLQLDEELRGQLVAMVKRSSNSAASAVLDRIGIERLAEILEDPAHGRLYDRERGGGLWVGKPYGRPSPRRPDPLHGLSHGATALAAARFYYGVMNGSLIAPRHVPLLREMFGEPAIGHKFVKGLKGRPADLYRKSGTWRKFHADSAVIVHHDVELRYIAVAIGEGVQHGEKMTRFIRLVDESMVSRATR